MSPDRPLVRVTLIDHAPGPIVVMARAYVASSAALLLRTPLRWLLLACMVAVASIAPLTLALHHAPLHVVAWWVAAGLAFGVASGVMTFAVAATAWSLYYMGRRARRASLVWVAARGCSTAVVWAERRDPTGPVMLRLWGSFPGGLGADAGRAALAHLDEHSITAHAYPRTAELESLYARSGFARTGATDLFGVPLLARSPSRQ